MASMSMNKAIHGAVRRDLTRFLDALDRFPDGDRARAEQLGRAWDNFTFELTYHHEGEHEIAWPGLLAIGVSPDLLAELDTEHAAMATALAEAGAAMATLRSTASASAVAIAACSVSSSASRSGLTPIASRPGQAISCSPSRW